MLLAVFQYPVSHCLGVFGYPHSLALMEHKGIYFPLNPINQYLWKAQQISIHSVNILKVFLFFLTYF